MTGGQWAAASEPVEPAPAGERVVIVGFIPHRTAHAGRDAQPVDQRRDRALEARDHVRLWTLGGIGELLYATWSWSLPRGQDNQGLVELVFDTSSQAADIGFNTAIGVFLLVTAVPVVRRLAAWQTRFAIALLTDRAA